MKRFPYPRPSGPWHRSPTMARWFVNPGLYREVRMARNPRHRHHHRRRHYRRNPGGIMAPVTDAFHHPGHTFAAGGLGVLAAYMTVAIPNMILPFPGTDLMSKLFRLV